MIDVLFATVSLVAMFAVIYLNYRANKMAQMAMKETRITRELESRPYIYFNMLLEQGGNVLNFCLSNRGKGFAKNLRVSIAQPLKIRRKEQVTIEEMAILKPISFLAPQAVFREFAEIAHIFFKDNEQFEEVTGKVDYEDASGKTYTTSIRINLKALGSKRNLIVPRMHNLVEAVEQLARVVQQKRR